MGESDGETAGFNSPPFAKGSRGINILPDAFFSPQNATPVRLRFFSVLLSKPEGLG